MDARVTRKRIGVIMGGTSSEREVSLATGRPILETLLARGYDAVGILMEGSDLPERLRGAGVELAFIALHGGSGENGAVQGLLEVMGIPYTGSGVLASAMAMDKVVSKSLFAAAGLHVPPYRVVRSVEGLREALAASAFPAPWVIKPAAEGSSIGVSIVQNEEEIDAAAREAFRYGDRVILEKYVPGREIQIGVLADRSIGAVEVCPSKSFYDYECKYTAGKTRYVLPPELDPSLLESVEAAALRAHRTLGCRAYSRVDFRLDPDGRPYILEVNTLPGMTPTSLLPKIARQAGIGFGELLEEIIGASIR